MSIRIRKYGDPILREVCRPVKKIGEGEKSIFSHMRGILFEIGALGVAAPQIGISQRLIAIRVDGNLIQLANPVIQDGWGKNVLTEGCLSIPEIFVKVSRSDRVMVEGVDERGKKREFEVEGIPARAIQHEIDHLNGTLIVDYATRKKKDRIKEKLEQLADYTRMVLRVKNK